MKYQAGDKVKIRTWEDMVLQYGVTTYRTISPDKSKDSFNHGMEKEINEKCSNRILTIKKTNNKYGVHTEDYYIMEEMRWSWYDFMIECLVEKPIPIYSRFEILDL